MAHPRAAAASLAAAAASYIGDEIAAIALAISVHDRAHSGFAVSAVVLATLLPRVLAGSWAGRLIDTRETTRLLAAVAGVSAVLTAVLAQASGFWPRLALLAALSLGSAITPNALMALVPALGGPDRSAGLLSSFSTVSRASALVGPLVGAALVAAYGVRATLLVDAVSFAVFAVVFLALPVRRRGTASSRVRGAAASGLRLLRGDDVLRPLLAVLATAIVFVGVSYVATVFLAKDVLGAGDAGTGALTAAYGGGMTLGCLAARRIPRDGRAALAALAPLAAGAGLLAAAVAPVLAGAAAGYVVAGTAVGLALTCMRAVALDRIPEGSLGRVFAAEGAIGAAGELAALALGGLLVTVAGAQVALAVAGAGTLVPSLVWLFGRTGAKPVPATA